MQTLKIEFSTNTEEALELIQAWFAALPDTSNVEVKLDKAALTLTATKE